MGTGHNPRNLFLEFNIIKLQQCLEYLRRLWDKKKREEERKENDIDFFNCRSPAKCNLLELIDDIDNYFGKVQ